MTDLERLCFNERHLLTLPMPVIAPEDIEWDGIEDFDKLVGTAVKNIEDLGFTIDENGYNALVALKYDKEGVKKLTDWYYDTVDMLKESIGGDVEYHPFYPDFPERYMDDKDLSRLLDQLAHYWMGYRPEGTDPKKGTKSLENFSLKILETIPENKVESVVREIYKNTIGSKMNLPLYKYKDILDVIIENLPDWGKDTKMVPNREVLSYLYANAIKEGKDASEFPALVANDILRIAKILPLLEDKKSYLQLTYAMKDERFSFNSVKLQSFPKKEQRKLVKMLSEIYGKNVSEETYVKRLKEDMSKDIPGWKIFNAITHIRENSFYKGRKYDPLKIAISDIYKDKIRTWNGEIEKLFQENNVNEAISRLSERPGMYIKSINRIVGAISKESPLHSKEENNELYKKFASTTIAVLDKCDMADVFSLYEYLNSREREDRLPIHNVKGSLYVSDKEYIPMDKDMAEGLKKISEMTIKNKIQSLDKNGQPVWEGKKIYIEPGMEDMMIPGKDSVDSSKSFEQYNKGSKIPIKADAEEKNIRFFIWWTNMPEDNPRSRVDIDLSVDMFGEDKKPRGELAYYDSGEKYNCKHSGDITDGGPYDGEGACEYIDLDMKALKENGVRYVRCHINSFSGQNFEDLNVKFGWMERSELDRSEQFNIRAVKQKSELSAPARGEDTVIIDTYENKVIWLDQPNFRIQGANNISTSRDMFPILMDRYGNSDRMSMGRLAMLAIEANGGELVNNKEEADILFTIDKERKEDDQTLITAKDNDIWVGQFMTPQIVNAVIDTMIKKEPKEKDVRMSTEEEIGKVMDEMINETTAPKKHPKIRDDMER